MKRSYKLLAVTFAGSPPRCCTVAAQGHVWQSGCSFLFRALPTNPRYFRVEPRGFEPLTSAVQKRHNTLLERSVTHRIPAKCRISASVFFPAFHEFHSGCCAVAARVDDDHLVASALVSSGASQHGLRCLSSDRAYFTGRTYKTAHIYPFLQHAVAKLHGGDQTRCVAGFRATNCSQSRMWTPEHSTFAYSSSERGAGGAARMLGTTLDAALPGL